MADEAGNAEEIRRKQQLEELLRPCAEHSWNNEKNNYRHRRQFEAAGINSAEELHRVLDQVVRDRGTRSFERQPNPDRRQSESSLILQARIQDKQGKDHQLTIVLNPDRDENGKQHGGTAYLNDPARPLDIQREFNRERARGFDPKIRLREDDLGRPDESATKTPAHRFIGEEGRQRLNETLRKLREREDSERENYRRL